MTEKIDILPSSGNVNAFLSLSNPDELLIKAELVRKISEIITQQQMTQADSVACRDSGIAAQLLGIEIPIMSALMRGKLTGFSTERLFRFLNDLGSDV